MYIEVDYAEKIARAAIVSVPGVGSTTLRRLLAVFGSARKAWKAPAAAHTPGHDRWHTAFFHKRHQVDPAQLETTLQRLGVSMTTPGEKNYPRLLSSLSDAPPILFYRGVLEETQKTIAIVGARRATPYGKSAAHFLGREIAAQGYVVISGLARGIDRAAHEGALCTGVTWAYLAGGLDKIYPAENRDLAEKITQTGALISEYPPGIATGPYAFPARNRLISGSSLGVVVAEAAERSGSLITVDFALEQGREVFAVPGPIFSPLSKGCHNLLRLGAHTAETAEDILQELPPPKTLLENTAAPPVPRPKSSRPSAPSTSACLSGTAPALPEDLTEYKDLFNYLSDVPLHIDRLAVQSSLPPQELAIGLLHLELAGYIQRLPGQHFVLDRNGPSAAQST